VIATDGEEMTSEIQALKSGYGFIKFPPNNLFFHYLSLIDTDFNDLAIGDKVSFSIGANDKGEPIAKDVKLIA
jgi:cold shock CspA family protein